MRILLIRSVESTQRTLLELIEYRLNVVGVMGYQPNKVDLAPDARAASIQFQSFKNINDHQDGVARLQPGIIFFVGLSQLIASEIVSLPQYGCVGFHPTQLNAGRGRALLAWLVLEQQSGAATFFHIGDGVDDGPIYLLKPFHVSEMGNAESVCEKLFNAMNIVWDHWLPDLATGTLHSAPQDHSQASWYARRTPEDGVLDWHRPVDELVRLVRATTRPHPRAFSFCEDSRILIWRAEVCSDLSITGVVGRVIDVESTGSFVVQCGEGLLRVTEHSVAESQWQLKVGIKLGYDVETEIFQLRQRLNSLQL